MAELNADLERHGHLLGESPTERTGGQSSYVSQTGDARRY
jgi:hypothetical protein